MKTKSWCISALLAFSLPLSANDLLKPTELSDAELAQLRGRYVLPDRIISFGVVMTSTWANASGQVIGAQVGMSLASGQLQPVLYATPINRAGGGSASVGRNPVAGGNGQVIGGAGLDGVRGVVQSVRVAGDGNQGENGMDIRISNGGVASVPTDAQAWTNGQTWSNGAGTVSLSSQGGGLAIAIQAGNGQGTASQQLGAGGMAQHSVIGGNLNTVRNMASLDIRLRDLPRSVDLRGSLEQLRVLNATR